LRVSKLVPELIWDADPAMIVTTHIPGVSLAAARGSISDDVWYEACRETGAAVASLMLVPMPKTDRAAFDSRFYGKLGPLESYLGKVMTLGRGVQTLDPDFQDEYWAESLDFVASQMPDILSQPRSLYHQDPGNLHIEDGRLAGFFDLEMCRIGGAAMQLAYCLGMFQNSKEGWDSFCEGWESTFEVKLELSDRLAVAAAIHLLGWRVICRYMSYDGNPGSGFDWASPADPAYWRQAIEEAEDMLEVKR
jgi:hypothetical protein